MAGFGEGDRGLHGDLVSHLADQDHVGRLAQRVAQRFVEGERIEADLALGDDATSCADA